MLIYDEAHSIRNVDAKSVAPLLEFAAECGYRLLLTATPLFNTVADLDVLRLLLLGQKTATSDKLFDPFADNKTVRPLLNSLFLTNKRRIVYQGTDPSTMPVRRDVRREVVLGPEYYALALPVDPEGEIVQAKRMLGRDRFTPKLMKEWYARKAGGRLPPPVAPGDQRRQVRAPPRRDPPQRRRRPRRLTSAAPTRLASAASSSSPPSAARASTASTTF